MKRQLPFVLPLASLLTLLPFALRGEDPVAAAAREEAAENYRTVSAKVARLEEEMHSMQSRMVKLTDEIYRLREEFDRLKNRNENAATLEKITKLQDAIKQVDEARQEDNKKVMAEIARIQRTTLEKIEKAVKSIGSSPAPAPTPDERRETPPSRPTPKPPPENSYKYTIKKGDTLSGIATALRSQGYKISTRQIEEANPGVNWSKLGVGREIIIPPPAQ